MGDGLKRQILSAEMMSIRLYMRKLIAKIINAKTMFGSECSSFESIFREDINDGYKSLYNIMIIFHTLLINESVDLHIPSQKNPISFPDHVENIITYSEK